MLKVWLIITITFACLQSVAQDKLYAKTYLIKNLTPKSNPTTVEIRLAVKSDNSFIVTVYTSVPVNPKKDSITNSLKFYDFDKHQIKNFILTKLPSINSTEIKKIINDLDEFYNPTKIVITGNGFTNFTSSTPNSFGTGATAGFGLSVTNPNGKELGIVGTVSQSKDTIDSQKQSDFGSSILVPGIRKFSLMLNFRNRRALGDKWGYGLFVNTTPINWQTYTAKSTGSSTYDSGQITNTVVPLTVELYLSYTWFTNVFKIPEPDNPVCITFDFGLTSKSMGGDQLHQFERKAYLGSAQKIFIGLLGGIDIRFAGSHAYFYSTFIPTLGKNFSDISGLTGFQIVGGIGLAANIATLKK